MATAGFRLSEDMLLPQVIIATTKAFSPTTKIALPYESLDVAYQFRTLKDSWRKEYGASSSLKVIESAPSYKQLIFLGKRVLPYILRDLQQTREPNFWFAALVEITGANPVPQSHRGNLRAMAADWLTWARSNGALE